MKKLLPLTPSVQMWADAAMKNVITNRPAAIPYLEGNWGQELPVQKRRCACGEHGLYKCQYCSNWFCDRCVFISRRAWENKCSALNDHLLTRTVIKEDAVRPTNVDNAIKQAVNLADLLRDVILLNPGMKYKSAQALGGLLAENAGITQDWQIAQAFVNAFADRITASPEELKTMYATEKMTLDTFTQLIAQKLLEAPK